jgi:hypothetical protein
MAYLMTFKALGNTLVEGGKQMCRGASNRGGFLRELIAHCPVGHSLQHGVVLWHWYWRMTTILSDIWKVISQLWCPKGRAQLCCELGLKVCLKLALAVLQPFDHCLGNFLPSTVKEKVTVRT